MKLHRLHGKLGLHGNLTVAMKDYDRSTEKPVPGLWLWIVSHRHAMGRCEFALSFSFFQSLEGSVERKSNFHLKMSRCFQNEVYIFYRQISAWFKDRCMATLVLYVYVNVYVQPHGMEGFASVWMLWRMEKCIPEHYTIGIVLRTDLPMCY